MPDLILTEMDILVVPRVEMALGSMAMTLVRRRSSMVQNPGQSDFIGKPESTPLMSASSRLGLNSDKGRNGETHNVENHEEATCQD